MPYSLYPYPVSEETLNELEKFKQKDWIALFKAILEEKPIDLNLDFTDYNPTNRFKELYCLLLQNKKIDKLLFQEAIVKLLLEYYGNKFYDWEIYHLIQTVDYIKPSNYYEELEFLVTNPDFKIMHQIKSVEGFSLQFHLVNAIMNFDLNGRLFKYLTSIINNQQPPEYYQITIRYLYIHGAQEQFNEFMNFIFKRINEDKNRKFILYSFNEYIYYKNNVSLIFYWLFDNKELLLEKDDNLFNSFSAELYNMLQLKKTEYKLKHTILFYPLWIFLSTLVKSKKLKLKNFRKLRIEKLENKNSFLFYLGTRNEEVKIEEYDMDCFKLLFLDEKHIIVDSKYESEIESFVDGVRETLGRKQKDDLIISSELIETSLLGQI